MQRRIEPIAVRRASATRLGHRGLIAAMLVCVACGGGSPVAGPSGSEFTAAQASALTAAAVACSTATSDPLVYGVLMSGSPMLAVRPASVLASLLRGGAGTSASVRTRPRPMAWGYPIGSGPVKAAALGGTYDLRVLPPIRDLTRPPAPADGTRIVMHRWLAGVYQLDEVGYLEVVDSARAGVFHVTFARLLRTDLTVFATMRAQRDSNATGVTDVFWMTTYGGGLQMQMADTLRTSPTGIEHRSLDVAVGGAGLHIRREFEFALGTIPIQSFSMMINGQAYTVELLVNPGDFNVRWLVRDGAGHSATGKPGNRDHMGDMAIPYDLGVTEVPESMRRWMNALGPLVVLIPTPRDFASAANDWLGLLNHWLPPF